LAEYQPAIGKPLEKRSWNDLPMTTTLSTSAKPLPGNNGKDDEEGPMTRSDIDATTPKYLRNKYAIVGVGETTYRRGSQESTRNLATWAINNALDDAGLEATDIDGMLSYSGNDSTFSPFVAGDLGIRLNFYMDVHGGAPAARRSLGSPWG